LVTKFTEFTHQIHWIYFQANYSFDNWHRN